MRPAKISGSQTIGLDPRRAGNHSGNQAIDRTDANIAAAAVFAEEKSLSCVPHAASAQTPSTSASPASPPMQSSSNPADGYRLAIS
jgi:hypothetical protein